MNTKPKIFGFYFPMFVILMPAAVALRSVALIKHLDEYGFFSEKLVITIANAIAIGAVLFFLSYMFTENKNIKLIPSFDSPASYAPSAAVAVALALLGVYLYTFAFTENHATKSTKPFAIVCASLAILSAIYFTVSTFIIRRRSMKRADFGIITLVFICAYVAYIYFDTTLPIGAPNKIVDQMTYLAASLFFLYETRLSLGREKWRSYISFGFIAAFMAAYSSIPSIIIYFKDGLVISNSIYESILSLTLFIFILSKILLTTTLVEDVESPIVTKIIAASKARSEAIAPAVEEEEPVEVEETVEEEDENQLSITDITLTYGDDPLMSMNYDTPLPISAIPTEPAESITPPDSTESAENSTEESAEDAITEAAEADHTAQAMMAELFEETAPVGEIPADEASAEEAPTEEATTDEAPIEEIATEESKETEESSSEEVENSKENDEEIPSDNTEFEPIEAISEEKNEENGEKETISEEIGKIEATIDTKDEEGHS